MRIRDLAHARPRFGSLRIWVLIRREGWLVNRKRVRRLYRLEGVQLRMRVRRRKPLALHRGPAPIPTGPTERWSMDFVQDTLAEGRPFRVLTVGDHWSRQRPMREVGVRMSGKTEAGAACPDKRTDEQKSLDQHFPAAEPEDFIIHYGGAGEDVEMTPELKAFDRSVRAWLSGAGLPRELGNSLVHTIAKVAQTTKGMTPDQLESYGYTEFQKLEHAFGATLEEKLQSAEMIHTLDLKHPGLKNLLRSKEVEVSALVASMLIGHAAIYHLRKGR